MRCTFACLVALAACGSSAATGTTTVTGTAASTPSGIATSSATPMTTVVATAPTTPPTGGMSVADARRYMLQLVNRDRATANLPPVVLEEGPASIAAQRHAQDMAGLAFLGHWGSDGSVPEQRYTESGGADFNSENAFCITDERARGVDPNARFTAADIERAESMFFNETPPNDGHRKNILRPFHKRVGIGLSTAKPQANELIVPCVVQEFIDSNGTYEALPRAIKVGDKLHIAGTLTADVKVGGVGLARIDEPHPLAPPELNRRRFYMMPNTYAMYWPAGFRTPIPVQTNGQSFSVDLPISDGGHRGLYEVSIWAQRPGEKDFAAVSLRTIRVE